MTRRLVAGLAVVALAVSAAWLVLRPDMGRDTSPVTRDATAPREGKAVSASPTAPPPANSRASGAFGRATPLAPKKTLFTEFVQSRQYASLYERLRRTGEADTPQGRLVLYEMLRECATVTGGVPWPFGARRNNEPKRDDFVAGIAPTDPQRERRIAAYDGYTADRCTGLSEVTMSQDDLLKLLRDSAAGGEPAARALSIEQDLWAARRASGTRSASPSDDQIHALQEAAGTRDPEAIRVAGRVLGNAWSDYALRIGPDELPVDPRPFVNAWLVLACEYGAPCGADTPRMQQACAFQGHCDARSFPEYVAYYGSTPHDSTLLMQYRGLIRDAIESGDWSAIRVFRGQAPATNRPLFIPGPR